MENIQKNFVKSIYLISRVFWPGFFKNFLASVSVESEATHFDTPKFNSMFSPLNNQPSVLKSDRRPSKEIQCLIGKRENFVQLIIFREHSRQSSSEDISFLSHFSLSPRTFNLLQCCSDEINLPTLNLFISMGNLAN